MTAVQNSYCILTENYFDCGFIHTSQVHQIHFKIKLGVISVLESGYGTM